MARMGLRAITFLVLFAILASFAAIMVDVPDLWLLSQRRSETTGIIEKLQPRNHDLVEYVFTVEGRTFTAHTTTRGESFYVGQRVLVYYDPTSPELSTLRDPSDQLRGAIVLSIGIGGVLAMLIVFVLVRRAVL